MKKTFLSVAIFSLSIVLLSGLILLFLQVNLSAQPREDAAKFDKDGKLLLPSDYRTWVFVGASVTPNEMNGGKAPFPEFHTIYMEPASYKAFKNTGKFPEGTVMVKETLMIGGKEAPSGKGYFMGDFLLLAAGVKDTKRFGGERSGWGFFVFGNPANPQSESEVSPVAECNNCHNAAAQEKVFVQYYPVLRDLKKK
jgi:hypothetical protein